ncbi:HCO3 transporter family-domain-containing protein [Kalaharituber pfeilii]|nr:HCO3 transporter family-domain-containing protein [Kalaharituber pfeilii]
MANPENRGQNPVSNGDCRRGEERGNDKLPRNSITALFRGKGMLRPFRLLKSDLAGRPKLYHTDWFFNQLIFASAVYLFFTNLLPGITFASDLFQLTGGHYGTIEVVFSTGLCGIIFALFSAQPLTILGVTGPFSILSERIYDLCVHSFHIEYLPFMAWSCIHAAWMHWLLAIFNAHDWTMDYVTTFSTEIFSLLNSVIYFHKAIQELERAHKNTSLASFLYSVIGCVGTFLVAVTLASATKWPVFHKYVRMGLSEYAAAISIIIFIAMPQIGELRELDQSKLPVSTSFRPTLPERTHFFVRFWELPIGWIFAAMIPGLIITVLFFFDVEVSTICATICRYNVRKPGGYAWDVALLGLTTAICGILGIPPANGLLPQAPLHSESLLHNEKVNLDNGTEEVIRTVHEQRWSHLLHAAGILAFVSPPLMHVLGLTPTSVLAGLFLFMGEQSLSVNPILYRFLDVLTPSGDLPTLPEGIGRYRGIHIYTLLQIVVTGVIFAITFTPAAPVFPVIIVMLVPIRLKIMNKFWGSETLRCKSL